MQTIVETLPADDDSLLSQNALRGNFTAKPGHRFYSPSLGRFINKDPIEEQGGLNLYGFCGNNGVNRWDLLGQAPYDLSLANPAYRDVIQQIINVARQNQASLMADSLGAFGMYASGFNDNAWVTNSPGGPASTSLLDRITNDRQTAGALTNAPSFLDGYFNDSNGSAVFTGTPGTSSTGSAAGNGIDLGTALSLDRFVATPTDDLALNAQANPFPTNNSGRPIIVVTPGGNALPVPPGGTIQESPDGEFIDVKGPKGKSTGDQIHGGHKPKTHPDPRGQAPHAHRTNPDGTPVTNPDGTPWLPVRPEPSPLNSLLDRFQNSDLFWHFRNSVHQTYGQDPFVPVPLIPPPPLVPILP